MITNVTKEARSQILLVGTVGNLWKTAKKICILMLGYE